MEIPTEHGEETEDASENTGNSGNTAELPRRRAGRPKGSRNKVQRQQSPPPVPKPRGRPAGTGHLQRARALAGVEEEPQAKRPVGRPSKLPPARQFSVTVGKSTVKGMPAVIRSRPAADSVESSNLHPIFTQSSTQTLTQHPSAILIPADDETEGGNDYSGLLNDGVGVGDDDEESDDEERGDDHPDPAHAHRPSPRRTARKLPNWLQSQFDSRVRESGVRAKDGLPPLYRDHRTMWFPVEDPYFATQTPESLKPEKLYHATFFLWDPAALVSPGRIACPNCKAGLVRHGHVPRPRRCVDIDRCIYIIGYRYRCPTCVNPKSGLHTITFRSWDSRILKKLSRPLAARFPRNAHSGMGSKQFSDALRVRHLERYDGLHVSYLSALAKLKEMSEWRGTKFPSFPAFEDNSSTGYHGFVPSSQWLRDLFDDFIELHSFDFDQAISLLSALICAIDHSFKLAKHIAKVNGEQIFIALLTITNQLGEIRVCNLVATKSHSQFELSLNRMRESLLRYGHNQPEIFYTDNMADKDFLERCFPSLRESVIAVEKYAHLDALEIPDDVHVNVLKNAHDINEVFRAIVSDLPDHDDGEKLVLFLDSEWNVEISERGYVTGRGATAILQIAYKDQIYVIQIGQMLAGGILPEKLKDVLTNPNILKVGRAVSGDLKHLQEACHSLAPFVGAVDLAQLAKDRLVVSSAKIGLADLCAKVLGKRVDKNVAERVSSAWEADLSQSQIRYASLDVHACRCIYDKLITIPVPSPLPTPVAVGTPVLLFHDGHARLIARGTITSLEGQYDQINLSRTRCLVEVTEVVVPAAVITTHRRTALQDFGPAPFNVVCLRSHLRLASDLNLPTIAPLTLPSLPSTSNTPPNLPSPDEEPQLGVLLSEELDAAGVHDPRALDNVQSDTDSQQEGAQVLAEARINWGIWKTLIRSRVIKDAFHIFNMFYISVVHGLRVEFARALRDAIFIPDASDKSRIEAWGRRQSPPIGWDAIRRSSPKWLWRRCKRIIPPPEELYPLVAKVFQIFGHLKDAKTGLPLFNSAAWAVAKNILELIQKGFLSDPPGISLYYVLGYDKDGLTLYRCFRGTNMTEGGVHTHLRSRLPTSGASVRHINASLRDFILRHNLVVGTFNSTGHRFNGHYSIWLTNEIQELLSYLEDVLINPRPLTGWVNGNLYLPTNEVSGVLPIPNDIRIKSGMAEFQSSLDSTRLHHHLAALQGTRKAVLPVHNTAEKDLFRSLMLGPNTPGNFSSSRQVENTVKIWNATADAQDDIYYKLAEQLKVYYSGDYQTNTNAKQTHAISAKVRAPLMKEIHDPRRLELAPPVPQTALTPHSVLSGMLSLTPVDEAAADSSTTTQAPPSMNLVGGLSSGAASAATIAGTVFAAGSSRAAAIDPPVAAVSSREVLTELSKRRVEEAAHESEPAPKRARRERTCRKCAVPDCPGKGSVKSCRNPCQDCGKAGQDQSCKGRDSKKLNYTCMGLRVA
ncbi:hypothetical protein C8R46DRAFT_1266577 [Mycena filopes]|nr:hypothetical protein C8R46DRAFT_1266577 [Mycena filopes]